MTDAQDQLKKFVLTEAVKRSGMLPSDRLLMMIFIDLAELYGDGDVWFVPEHRTPSLTELTEWSGLGRTTVGKRLNHLEGLGWVKRSRPATADALGRHERTAYRLAIGDSVEREKPSRPGRGRYAEPSATAGLVQPLHSEEEAEETRTVVQPLHDPGATAAPDLVQPLHDPSAAVAHNNQPPTGVGFTQGSHQDQQTPPSTADAAAAAPALPGFDTTETEQASPPPKPKRKRATKAPTEPKPPTEGQRVNVLAKRYTDVVSFSPFQAVRGVVAAAVKCGDYSDEQIAAGLDRLAAERRTVSINTLRIALEGDRVPARTGAYQDPPGRDIAAYRKDF